MSFFKRAYMPYLFFLAGAVLIFFWARARSMEPFANANAPETAGAYAFEMYYADWCPHCKTAKPEFARLGAIQTIGGKQVAYKMVEAEQKPAEVKGGEVKGYPTFRLFDPQGKMMEEYNGERTHAGFQAFLNQMLGAK